MVWHVYGLCRTKLKSISQRLIFVVSWHEESAAHLVLQIVAQNVLCEQVKTAGGRDGAEDGSLREVGLQRLQDWLVGKGWGNNEDEVGARDGLGGVRGHNL